MHAELAKDMVRMSVYRADRDAQLFGDFSVRQSHRNELQHLKFARGQGRIGGVDLTDSFQQPPNIVEFDGKSGSLMFLWKRYGA